MLELQLLQRKFGNQPGQADPDPATALAVIAFYGVLIAVGIVIQVFFLLTLSRCLKQVSPRNRQMEPGQVWFNLIPCFNLVWMILTILKVSDSLRDEYEDRRMRGDGDFGKTTGIIFYVSNFFCGIVALIFFIMYWVKIAGYARELAETGRRSRRGGDFDDGDDDRPRRRRPDGEDDLDR